MNIFSDIVFLDKIYFLIILFVPLFLYLSYKKSNIKTNFIFFKELKYTFKINSFYFHIKNILISLIIILFALLLANPNLVNYSKEEKKDWIDIVLVFDVSISMEATDLVPSRIIAARSVINSFVSKLKTDRLWLVLFAWKPFTSIPLTFDYDILKESISKISTNSVNQQLYSFNWTAIWDALIMAKTLFKKPENMKKEDYDKRQKIVILITDWEANKWIDPIISAKLLKENNINIYSVWIWSYDWWVVKFYYEWFLREEKIPPLNDEKLKILSQITNWKYFRADNNEVLNNIFEEIWKLQKTEISVTKQVLYKEYYNIFIYILSFLIFLLSLLFILKPNFRD